MNENVKLGVLAPYTPCRFNLLILLGHDAAAEPTLRDNAGLREKALVAMVLCDGCMICVTFGLDFWI